MVIIDLLNKHISPRVFSWSEGIIIDSVFIGENNFFTVGKNHFYFWDIVNLESNKLEYS